MIKMDVGTPGGIVSQISPAPHLTSEGEYWFRELFTPSQNLSVKGKETDLVGLQAVHITNIGAELNLVGPSRNRIVLCGFLHAETVALQVNGWEESRLAQDARDNGPGN